MASLMKRKKAAAPDLPQQVATGILWRSWAGVKGRIRRSRRKKVLTHHGAISTIVCLARKGTDKARESPCRTKTPPRKKWDSFRAERTRTIRHDKPS